MAAAKEIFIVSAKRTAFGKFGGKLSGIPTSKLAVHAVKSALAAGNVSPEIVDSLCMGNVLHTSMGESIYLARHTALDVGMRIAAPALLVNRLCGSGFESIIQAYKDIFVGESDVAIAGGVESMSRAPYMVDGIRFGTKFGGKPLILEDYLYAGLMDTWCNLPMALTAEALAEKYNISRKECEEYSYESCQKWARANSKGLLQAEMAPVPIKGKKKEEIFDCDEHPRPETTLEAMAKLPPVFKKEGKVTAATASGVNDGAGALILASGEAVKKHNLTPLARIVSYMNVGVPPEVMGIGPVSAIEGALKRAGLEKSQMDFVEINEAFAPQVMACNKELKFDPAVLNTCGGAVAVGHPLAASGSRIMAHLAHKLQRENGRYGVGSACIGGGQGTAVVIERC